MHGLVAPVRRENGAAACQNSGARRLALVATSLLALVATLGVVSRSSGGQDGRAALALGHYVENGKIHYFQMASPPPSAYAAPGDDDTEYRSASTSGLGFAGGGDPYKYIRTGHYAKILAEEDKVQAHWGINGTGFDHLAAMRVVQSRLQELAELPQKRRDIKSRDESLLALLSA